MPRADPSGRAVPTSIGRHTCKQAQPGCQRIGANMRSCLIHEAFQRPICPAGIDGPWPAGAKGVVGKVIQHRPNLLCADLLPVIRTGNGKGIIGFTVYALGHEEGRHHVRGPAAAWCSMPVTAPFKSNAIRWVCTEGERTESNRASSARVRIILTRRPSACAASAAGIA